MSFTRKEFLHAIGGSALAVIGAAALPKSQALEKKPAGSTLTLGLASYSVRNFNLSEVIQMTKRLRLTHLCLKSMHLPLDSSDEHLKSVAKIVKDAGLELYGAGVIYMRNEAEVHQAFHYAKLAGMKVIVGVPNHELLDLVEEKVKEYDIIVAIHNHGPGDELYPSPESVYMKIKDRDARLGLCIDIGHTERIKQNCSEQTRRFADRLYDIHLKDVDVRGEPGKSVELGSGVIDIPEFIKTLLDINYKGVVSLEYEKDPDDPLPGMAESVGYTRGILDML